MKAIHRHIFKDVYEWAGEERQAPSTFMTKEGHAYYPAGEALTDAANTQYAQLKAANYFKGLPRDEFVNQLAEVWGEINVIHSFREGNTRAQFVFFSQLAEQAGYELDPTKFLPGMPVRDEFVAARFHGQDTGDNTRLAAALDKAVINATPPSSGPSI